MARQAIKLRYHLLPYLYTLAHHAHEWGTPILRPLVYDFPDDTHVYQLGDQVMVGPHLLVAPVYRPGQDHRIVYLPEGVWYDFWSGEKVAAGYRIVHAPLGRIPIFARGGAVLPLGNDRASSNAPISELTLSVYPAGRSRWTVLEDDGLSFAYQENKVARLTVEVDEVGPSIDIKPDYERYEPHTTQAHFAASLGESPSTRDAGWRRSQRRVGRN